MSDTTLVRFTAEGPQETDGETGPGFCVLRLNYVDACTIQAALALAVNCRLFAAPAEAQRADFYRSQLFEFLGSEGRRMTAELRRREEDGRL